VLARPCASSGRNSCRDPNSPCIKSSSVVEDQLPGRCSTKVSQSNEIASHGRITKRGSTIARKSLVQCALIAKRYSPYLHGFFEKVKAKRGVGKAIIATARKLLNTVFYTLKNNWVFQDFPNFKLLPCNQS
jgi:hypothetical protein